MRRLLDTAKLRVATLLEATAERIRPTTAAPGSGVRADDLAPIHGRDLGWLSTEARRLLGVTDTVVPVVGSGISRHAGLSDGQALAYWMADLPMAAGFTFERPGDCLRVADSIVGNDPMKEFDLLRAVASKFDLRRERFRLTETLRSLVHARSRLILTFNYDALIEEAAAAEALPFNVVHRDSIREARDALRQSPDRLTVVHLHGSADRPDSLVLTGRSYMAHVNDGLMKQFVSAVINTKTLCFIGLSLDEEYILNALLEAGLLSPAHVYVSDEISVAQLRASRYRHGMSIASFPAGEWDQLDWFSRAAFRDASLGALA